MEVLKRARIAEINDRKFENVETKYGVFRLQTISLKEAFEVEMWAAKKNMKVEEEREGLKIDVDVAQLATCLVDEDNKPLYPDVADGYEDLLELGASLVTYLIAQAKVLHNSNIAFDKTPEKVIEKLAKNSETPPNTTSTVSPSASEELTPVNS